MSVASWCCKSFCVVPCVSFCTGHFVLVPLNMTYLHCLQHSLFEHLFNLYLFIYVSTHYVQTVKWLDYNRYCRLTRWCSGNASVWVQEVPGSIPGSGNGCMFHFLLCCCCVFTFLSKTHYLSQKFAIPFCTVNLFSILNILQDFWPIIRV